MEKYRKKRTEKKTKKRTKKKTVKRREKKIRSYWGGSPDDLLSTKADEVVGGPEELMALNKEIVKNFEFIDKFVDKGFNELSGIGPEDHDIDYDPSARVAELILIYFSEKYKQQCPMYPIHTTIFSMSPTFNIGRLYTLDEYDINELTKQLKEDGMTDEEMIKQFIKNKEDTMREKQAKEAVEHHRMLMAHYPSRTDYVDWDRSKFLKNLKLCLETGEELILIPLRMPSHLNMLIIKVPTREIIRYEPHGPFTQTKDNLNKETNTFLYELTEDINTELNLVDSKKFIYHPPTNICPLREKEADGRQKYIRGFQSYDDLLPIKKISDTMGYCQLWSWFFAECIIQNPRMDIKEVYKEAYNFLKTKSTEYKFVIIRGYYAYINEELKKISETLSLKRGKRERTNERLLAYLNKSREHLLTKERKVFQGGNYLNILKKGLPKKRWTKKGGPKY